MLSKKPGDRVRMTEAFKKNMIARGCADHIEEFGDCEGIVEGPTYPHADCDEVDVKWLPFGTKFAYFPINLEHA